MATAVKAKKPAVAVKNEASAANNKENVQAYDNMTVEEFLQMKFKELADELRAHTAGLVKQLQAQYAEGASSIEAMMASNSESPLCVVLKCVAGPHIGQRFRLEASKDQKDEVFKMGRSTGKLFKEKGVSLYKDKEISTTHAKIELRNGEAFFIDAKSTNGSHLNGMVATPSEVYRLKDGDIILMGSTELVVHIAALDDDADALQSFSGSMET